MFTLITGLDGWGRGCPLKMFCLSYQDNEEKLKTVEAWNQEEPHFVHSQNNQCYYSLFCQQEKELRSDTLPTHHPKVKSWEHLQSHSLPGNEPPTVRSDSDERLKGRMAKSELGGGKREQRCFLTFFATEIQSFLETLVRCLKAPVIVIVHIHAVWVKPCLIQWLEVLGQVHHKPF